MGDFYGFDGVVEVHTSEAITEGYSPHWRSYLHGDSDGLTIAVCEHRHRNSEVAIKCGQRRKAAQQRTELKAKR